jgi:hypothetical protein
MINQHDKLREVSWNELFRWLMLLRAVRIALLARVMVLGALGLIATTLGWWTINYFFANTTDPVVKSAEWQRILTDFLWNTSPEFSIVTSAQSADALFRQVATGLAEAPVSLWLFLTRPFINMFHGDLTPTGFLYFALCGIWELLVWGLFGGAISRIAALKFTRDEAPDLPAALKHAFSKLTSYSMAPLLALAGAAVFGLQLAALGAIMRLDLVALVAAVVWPFALVLGLLMAILLIGALAGWPLMWATVGVEGTDAFDALSRSYAYVYQRPLRLLWYVLLAAILAAVSMFFVKLFATSAISLGNWAVSWGLDTDTYREIVAPLPGNKTTVSEATTETVEPAPAVAEISDTLGIASTEEVKGPALVKVTPDEKPVELSGSLQLAKRSIRFWKSLLGALAAGYQAGFLFVASVGVYLLLRKDIDGAEMDEVYVEDEPDFGMPPLADDHITGVPEVQTDFSSPESTSIT